MAINIDVAADDDCGYESAMLDAWESKSRNWRKPFVSGQYTLRRFAISDSSTGGLYNWLLILKKIISVAQQALLTRPHSLSS